MRRFLLAGLVFVLLSGSIAGLWARQTILQPLLVGQGDHLLVVVRPGDTLNGVIARLVAGGHLRHVRVLQLWARMQGGLLRIGEYELPANIPASEVMERLLGGRVVLRSFTIIEGWTVRQLREALAAEPRLRQETDGLDEAALMARLEMPGEQAEGWFAPDTYFFAGHADSDLDVLRRALAAQRSRLDAAWAGREENLPYRAPREMLVMASLVEKETGQAAERPAIAGVFVRRLRIGMRLQTDPAVIYGLGESFRGNLTREHLRKPTPWNTYVIEGLPPTPIALPGAAAIEAAAHPRPGLALYFVGRGDGSHQFSATLAEHNAAVRKYQLKRRADYHSAPAP